MEVVRVYLSLWIQAGKPNFPGIWNPSSLLLHLKNSRNMDPTGIPILVEKGEFL